MLQQYKILENIDPAIYAALHLARSRAHQLQYHNTDQVAFAGWMHLMSLRAEEILSSGSPDYAHLFSELGGMRHIQARAVGSHTTQLGLDFGDLRKIGSKTDWTDQYSLLGNYLDDVYGVNSADRFISAVGPNDTKTEATKLRFNGRNWRHAEPSQLPVIRRYFEAWTNRILTTDYTDKRDELVSDLSNWYHTSVQGTFFYRGSSAITQSMFVALCRLKKIEPPAFIELVDYWALSMEAGEFKSKIFEPWFNRKPIPIITKYQKS